MSGLLFFLLLPPSPSSQPPPLLFSSQRALARLFNGPLPIRRRFETFVASEGCTRTTAGIRCIPADAFGLTNAHVHARELYRRDFADRPTDRAPNSRQRYSLTSVNLLIDAGRESLPAAGLFSRPLCTPRASPRRPKIKTKKRGSTSAHALSKNFQPPANERNSVAAAGINDPNDPSIVFRSKSDAPFPARIR